MVILKLNSFFLSALMKSIYPQTFDTPRPDGRMESRRYLLLIAVANFDACWC